MEAAASIMGLLAIGAKVYTTLETFISACKDAPSLALATHNEVRDFHFSLQRMQGILLKKDGLEISQLGKSVTDVSHLTFTLLACMATFSEVERVLDRLLPRQEKILGEPPPFPQMSYVKRIRWTIAGGTLSQLITRIQRHKLSLTLLLTIWITESSAEAEHSVDCLNDVLTDLSSGEVQAKSSTSFNPSFSGSSTSVNQARQSSALDLSFHGSSFNVDQAKLSSTPMPGSSAEPDSSSILTTRSSWSARSKRPITFLMQLRNTRPYRQTDCLDSTGVSTRTSQRLGMQFSKFTIDSNHSIFSLSYTKFEQSGRKLAQETDAALLPVGVTPEHLYNPWWYTLSSLESQIEAQGHPAGMIAESLCTLLRDATARADTTVLAMELSRAHMDTSYSLLRFCLEVAISSSNIIMVSWLLDWIMERYNRSQPEIIKFLAHGDNTLTVTMFNWIKVTLDIKHTVSISRFCLQTLVESKNLSKAIELLEWIKEKLSYRELSSLYACSFITALMTNHVPTASALLRWGVFHELIPNLTVKEDTFHGPVGSGSLDPLLVVFLGGAWGGGKTARTYDLVRTCIEYAVLKNDIDMAAWIISWMLKDDSQEAYKETVNLLNHIRLTSTSSTRSMALHICPKIMDTAMLKSDLDASRRLLVWMIKNGIFRQHSYLGGRSQDVARHSSRLGTDAIEMDVFLDIMAEKDIFHIVNLCIPLLSASFWGDDGAIPITVLYSMMKSNLIEGSLVSHDVLITELRSNSGTMIGMLDVMESSDRVKAHSLLRTLLRMSLSNSYINLANTLLDWIGGKDISGARDLHILALETVVKSNNAFMAGKLLHWNDDWLASEPSPCRHLLGIALQKRSMPVIGRMLDWISMHNAAEAAPLLKTAINTASYLKDSDLLTELLNWAAQKAPEEATLLFEASFAAALLDDDVEMVVTLLEWVHKNNKVMASDLYSSSVQSTLPNRGSAMHLALKSWGRKCYGF
ncbi:hypothetical protein DFP73DRAFT_585977 [Morchella snyderi]|nr:hypothetical protein DFP73DRAFT_585977 [Morchella snyderi]